ncbi:hypothetical protein D4764_09G0009460 [Takifugu flavidus]|uniref:Dynein regulatory complex protein 10 n=1 Tax=Takifugu flavidus TaxID=433684 RepID=A0A5C6ML67_9TELE|nr:hypothetical protein D4764_09G0009460 [Takifugu flavidus]
MDSEVIRALQEHLMLEQRLEMLEDRNLVSDGKNENTHLEKNLKISLKNLLRLVKARPLLLSAWKKDLPKEIGKCERCLIKEIHVLEGLEPRPQQAAPKLLPVSDELNDTPVLQDFPATIEEVTTKIFQKSQDIETLQSSLQKQREEESALEEQLQTTTEELETEIVMVDAATAHLIEDFDEAIEALQASLELNTMKYEQEVEEVKKLEMLYSELDVDYRYILEKHRQVEEKKRIKRVDTVTERLTEAFDEEMEALQESFERVTKEYEQEVEEVERLEMLYSELDVEYRNILENRRLAEEKKEKEAKQLMLMTEAALLIQAYWRGYGVRKALKERGKKGKGKKGKKGKGSKGTKKAGKKS